MTPPKPPVPGRVRRTDEQRSRRAARGQSAVIGVVLVTLVVVSVVGFVVTAGSGALADSRRSLGVERAEKALVQLDARGGMVALGDASGQTVSLGDSSPGQYAVEPDAGWIRVVHTNYTGDSDEVIYNRTLGAVTYRDGDAVVAYQGGGVWRANGNGSVMVSPPEVHYKEETFVLPVVRVAGESATKGDARAVVRPDVRAADVYPRDSAPGGDSGPGAPYDDTDDAYANPLEGGSVHVTVKSEFYRGWAAFFRTRTDGAVTVNHSAQTATLQLVAPRTIGLFDMPSEGNAIDIRGISGGHPLERFEISLAPDDADAANFDNLQWTLYADSGRQEFEIHLRLAGPDNDPDTACKEQDVSATVYYSERNGNPYHGWRADDAFGTTCVDRDDDGQADEVVLNANLTGTTGLTMTDLSSDDLHYFNTGGDSRSTSVQFGEHAGVVGWEPTTFADGGNDTVAIDILLGHYTELLGPSYDLVVDDQNSDTVDEDRSTGVLYYDGEGRITFMHVTDNRIVVTLE